MNLSTVVFLIGMPGAGKSHWARVWGLSHGVAAVDLDTEIERSETETVAALFLQGAHHFRSVEQEVLHLLIKNRRRPFILATGGGTPCFHDNLQHLMDAGMVVYLKAGISTLVRNLVSDPVQRPLLQGGDLHQKLEAMLEARAPFYEQAHFTIPVEDATEASLDFIFAPCTDRP